LGSPFVFTAGRKATTGWSNAKRSIDAAIAKFNGGEPIPEWRIHDLRRSTATGMAEDLKVPPHIVEAALNHVSSHKAGVAGIYNRSTYAAEKRAALDLWAHHLRMIVAQAEGANVTRLKRG